MSLVENYASLLEENADNEVFETRQEGCYETASTSNESRTKGQNVDFHTVFEQEDNITTELYDNVANRIAEQLSHYKDEFNYFLSEDCNKVIKKSDTEDKDDVIEHIISATTSIVAFRIYEILTGTNKVDFQNEESEKLFGNIYSYLECWREWFRDCIVVSSYKLKKEEKAYADGVFTAFINIGCHNIIAFTGVTIQYAYKKSNSDK